MHSQSGETASGAGAPPHSLLPTGAGVPPPGAGEAGPIRRRVAPDAILQSLDFHKIATGLLHRWPFLAAGVLASLALAFLSYRALDKPSYSAFVRLIYMPEAMKPISLRGSTAFEVQPFSRGTILKLLVLPANIEKAIELLGLDLDLKRVRSQITVEEDRQSELVRLEIWGAATEAIACDLINKLADVAVEENARLYETQVTDAARQLEQRRAETSQRLAEVSAQLEQLQREGGGLDLGAVDQFYAESLARLNERLSTARLEEEALRLRLENYPALLAQLPDHVVSRSFEDNPLKRRLSNAEMALMEARTQYGPDNPKVTALELEIKELRRMLQGGAYDETRENVYEPNPAKALLEGERIQLEAERAVAADKVVRLAGELEAMQASVAEMPARRTRYASLLAQRQEAEVMLAALKANLAEAELLKSMGSRALSVVAYADEAKPGGSMKAKAAAAAVLVLLGSGVFATALILELADPRLRTRRQLETALTVPCIGVIEHVAEAREAALAAAFLPALREIAEELPRLRRGGRTGTLLLSSATRGEGKSQLTFRLARYYAALDMKVAVADFDAQPNPCLPAGATPGSAAGIERYLRGQAAIEELLSVVDGVHAYKVLERTEDLVELLRGELMSRFWNALTASHDLVIIEAPPLLADPAAIALAQAADAFLLVVNSRVARRKSVYAAVARLGRASLRPLATVLNSADPAHSERSAEA